MSTFRPFHEMPSGLDDRRAPPSFTAGLASETFDTIDSFQPSDSIQHYSNEETLDQSGPSTYHEPLRPVLSSLHPPPPNDSPTKDLTGGEKAMMEKNYLLSCERGDTGSVRAFLKSAKKRPKDLNINALDPLSRSALLIAIENENIEMIELLLDANIETGDAILYAIGEENVEAVEIILDHLEKINKFNLMTQGVEISQNSAFTPDMTPLIFAAHKDNYEIIKLLLDKKATVPHPHDVRCHCKECREAKADDSLRLSRSRFNAYMALASPSLICLSATDPILYAFELSSELRLLSRAENEYRNEYQELSRKCQKFSVNMLDQIRGTKELEIVLNHTTNAWQDVAAYNNPEEVSRTLARLKLAIQLRQKRFVAHSSCQFLLTNRWHHNLQFYTNRNILLRSIIVIIVSLSSPLLALSYLIAPKSCFGSFIKKPFIKFICHTTHYIIFLFLLILASQRIDYTFFFDLFSGTGGGDADGKGTSEDDDTDRKELRGPPPTPVELAILCWVLGFIWVEIKQLWDCGFRDYIYDLWNILDFITNSLYLCTLALRTVAFFQVEKEMKNPEIKNIVKNLHRQHWDAWDPTLISECMFATANIFSSLKLVHIFTVNPHLGPLKISLGRMVIDILKFFIVYCLVLFAFACGLNQLNWYYAAMRQQECLKFKSLSQQQIKYMTNTAELKSWEESCDQKYKSCSSLYKTLETLFWALFGLIDLGHFELKEEHAITEWTGKTIFGSYCCCSIIVLLNMLIAMMSNSYQYISDQADSEWKFARSKLWMEYFDDTGTLPAPYNIIPSPKSFYFIFRWFFENFTQKLKFVKQKSMRRAHLMMAEREKYFGFVTHNLIKRYIAQMQRRKQMNEGVSEDDVNEIKQDISAFRFELLGILRASGYQTMHSDVNQKMNSRAKRRAAMAERRMKGTTSDISFPIPEEWNAEKPPIPAPKRSRSDSLANIANTLKISNWSHLNKLRKRVSFKKSRTDGSFDQSASSNSSSKLAYVFGNRKESIVEEENEESLTGSTKRKASECGQSGMFKTLSQQGSDAVLKRINFKKRKDKSSKTSDTQLSEELVQST